MIDVNRHEIYVLEKFLMVISLDLARACHTIDELFDFKQEKLFF